MSKQTITIDIDVRDGYELKYNPETRTIQQITVDDDAATSILFEQLMGTGVTARKAYIKEHSKEAVYNAE